MTLFRRILLYYVVTLSASLVLVAASSWVEFDNQLDLIRQGDITALADESPLEETLEIVLYAGLPAVLLGVVSGMIALRPALRPIKQLTAALEQTDVSNLAEAVPRSGNGDELDRLAAVFEGMKERLGRSFTQTREFTLHASHELKTPLTIIHGTLEQMLAVETPGSTAGERLASLLEEIQRLSGIVSQLSFLAGADAGLLENPHEPVALHDLAADLADETAVLGSAAGVSVTLAGCVPATVSGDRMRLRQLLLVLADNAVKYSPPSAGVEISLFVRQELAVFRITNPGPALPPDARTRVFERFFRGNPAHNRAIDGSGLGLSIAKSIVDAHQGEITYEVLADGRTEVTVNLPLRPG